MSPDTESDLMSRCRRGESAAWDEIFSLHYDATGRFIFQLAADFSREDAEEICQETFLSVIKNIQSFQGQSQFQTWLFRVAANKARDFRERQYALKRGGGQTTISLQAEDEQSGLTIDPPSHAPGPDAQLVNGERSTMLHHALETLGDPCREIIELRYFGDLDYEEIGRTLQLNPKTVSSRLSRCLDRLEEILRPHFDREKSTPFSV
ncbi:MAG: sigma-70 family RNA polymerase sigma factor [Verrucomicrobia bacterium]|nr:sigma-70 family RNA polymerase sigma factor [Verrucomicrobiota bacterium]